MSVAPGHCQECCMWNRNKYALFTKFREPKMYQFAAEGDWELIPARCKSHPKEAYFVNKYSSMDTPLSRLLRTDLGVSKEESKELKNRIFSLKHSAVAALLNTNPLAPTDCDNFKRTPLHWGCMDVAGNHSESAESEQQDTEDLGANSSVLVLLIKSAPEAARMVDVEERTPLHYLVARNDVIPIRLMATLVALYPESLHMRDGSGETPLDILRSREGDVRNVGEIITAMQRLYSMLPPSSSPSSGQRSEIWEGRDSASSLLSS